MAWRVPVNYPRVAQVVSKLNFLVKNERRKFRNLEGSYGQLKKLRVVVTSLVKHERIELDSRYGLEARGYTERLISEAIRNGDTHQRTMELADFWLEEKQLVNKLFKVLVPRYENFNGVSYTRFYKAPTYRSWKDDNNEFGERRKIILELKGNPYPPVKFDKIAVNKQIHNILLGEVRREFYEQKHNENKI